MLGFWFGWDIVVVTFIGRMSLVSVGIRVRTIFIRCTAVCLVSRENP